MVAGAYDIVADQGATFNQTLTYRDSAGALVDLTGYTARMQVRYGYDDPNAVIDLTTANGGITLGGAAGTIALLITAAVMSAIGVPGESRIFRYDLELVSGSVVTRLLAGKFTVTREITR